MPEQNNKPVLSNWPYSANTTQERQASLTQLQEEFDLGNGIKIKFSGIPAGKYIKGNPDGYTDERKLQIVEIEDPFGISSHEITNAMYALFDSTHNSRFIDQQWKDHTTPGYPANLPDQPVIRISYFEALEFCRWLSRKTGMIVSLPTEEQWEWACRAGTASDFWYGDLNTDFSGFENLADNEIRKFAVKGVNPQFIGDDDPDIQYYAFIPRVKNVNDGYMVANPVGSFSPNAWGLYDMHGNVAEWTSTSYEPTGGSQDQHYQNKMKVVKGGSWRDRPKISTSGSKRYYAPYQKVFNVGFRVVINENYISYNHE